MAAKKAQTTYWFFNTDETELVGEGAHQRMIDRSCIAAWGDCIRHGGAKETLEQPEYGDTVFLFRSGHGIVAIADVTDEPPTPSTTIFPDGDREFKRPVRNLRVAAKPLSFAAIRDATGYDLPCRHIVCRVRNDSAVKYILRYFADAKRRTLRRNRRR
jgi:EVE domain